jgi:hypothetical protein
VDDEDFEADATDLTEGDSGDFDGTDVDVVDSLAGSLGHLRNVSLTTKAVMALTPNNNNNNNNTHAHTHTLSP